MAKKRASLKDRNVFKGSKDLGDLIGSSGSKTEKEETMAEEKREEEAVDFSVGSSTSDPAVADDELSALDDEAAAATEAAVAKEAADATEDAPSVEDLPTGEAEIDLAASLSEEASVATASSEPSFSEDALNFPPALEEPPAGEAGLDFPPALEAPPGDDIDLGFLPAIDAPRSDATVEDLPVGEAATEFDTSFDASPLAAEDPDTFPPALEASPHTSFPEDLPLGESGLETPEDIPIGEAGFEAGPSSDFGAAGSFDQPTFSTDPTAFGEPTAPSPTDSLSRPVPPPATSPPPIDEAVSTALPAPPQTGAGTYAVSRTTPLTLDDDSPKDIFDFMGVADEPATIKYQIPDDVEELTPEERKRRMLLLTDDYVKEQFEKIYKAIDDQYEKILDDNVSSNQRITDWAHNLLAETRYILMNYQIEHLAKAEWNIQQVKAKLDRADESEKWRKKWAWPIIGWGLIWFFTFVILIFNPVPVLFLLETDDIRAMSEFLVPEIFLRTIFFGGIGGITSVFYDLLKYVSSRNYDKEYNISYFVKPFMGMIIGTLIYLIIYVVGRLFGVTPTGALETLSDDALSDVQVFAVITYFVALASGFKHNVAFQLLSRMMRILFRDDREKTEDLAAAAPPSGPFN